MPKTLRSTSCEQDAGEHHPFDDAVFDYPGRPGLIWRLPMAVRCGGRVLVGNDRLALLSRAIDAAFARRRYVLLAFVYLPDRVELIAAQHGMMGGDDFLQRLKQGTARKLALDLKRTDPALRAMLNDDHNRRFWCTSSRHNTRDGTRGPDAEPALPIHPRQVEREIDMLHWAPAHAGLCRGRADWPWSSHLYYHPAPGRDATRVAEFPNVCMVRRDAARWA